MNAFRCLRLLPCVASFALCSFLNPVFAGSDTAKSLYTGKVLVETLDASIRRQIEPSALSVDKMGALRGTQITYQVIDENGRTHRKASAWLGDRGVLQEMSIETSSESCSARLTHEDTEAGELALLRIGSDVIKILRTKTGLLSSSYKTIGSGGREVDAELELRKAIQFVERCVQE